MKTPPTFLVRFALAALASSACLPAAEYIHTSGQRVADLYVADGLPQIRAVYVNWKRGSESYNGVPTGSRRQYEDQQWRDFLAGLGVASMLIDGLQGSDSTAQDGGGAFIIDSLNAFASQSGRPELAHAPILIWGHSKSANFASTFANGWPSRTLGFIQFHGLNTNQYIDELGPVGDVPALLLGGQNDNTLDPQLVLDQIVQGRAAGNVWGGGIEIGLPHGGGTEAAYYVRSTIIHPWILSIVNKRLPAPAAPYTSQPALQPVAESSGYLGDQGTSVVASGAPASNGSMTTAPYASYSLSRAQASWLPDAAFARVWQAYFQSGDAAGLAVKTVLVTAVDPQASEAGPAGGAFSITRAGDLSAALTVNYSLSGTAAAGSDYASLSGSVTLAAGVPSVTLSITPINDTTAESTETVVLTLTPAAGYEIVSPAAATVSIADNDVASGPIATITASDSQAAEPSNGGALTVTLSPAPASNVTVGYSVSGTATSGTDFNGLPGTVTVGTSGTAVIPITVIDDATVESTEAILVQLGSGAGYSVGSPASATVNLADNDSTTGNPVTVTLYSTGANDGYVTESTETSNVGGANAAGGTGSAALRVGDTATDQQVKTIVSFDTSSIPDGATITGVTLRLQRGSVNGTSPFGTHGGVRVDVRSGSFGAVSLENADFQAAASATNVATLSAPAANGDWASGALSSSALAFVNKTGTTQFRVYCATDDNNDNGRDDVGFYPGEGAAGTRPELIITYTP